MATNIFPIKPTGFNGMKCTWYVSPESSSDRLFHCVSNSQTDSLDMEGKITEASLTVPEGFLNQMTEPDRVLSGNIYNLFISMQANSNFFPIDEERRGEEDVTTAVVGTKLGMLMIDLIHTNYSVVYFR